MIKRSNSSLATAVISNYFIMVIVALALPLALARGGDLSVLKQIDSAQVNGSITNLMAISAEVETLWPTNALDYFRFQNQVGKALQTFCSSNTDARIILERQSGLMIEKKCPEDVFVIEECLSAKWEAVQRLTQMTNSCATLPIAHMMATVLGEVRSAIITNYQWAIVYAKCNYFHCGRGGYRPSGRGLSGFPL
jgi:hypothetical protein